jgi:DNA polymerase V
MGGCYLIYKTTLMSIYWVLADINGAYVSFCTLFNPHLKGKPIGVLSSNQGNVIARNQEIKDLGVRMGEPAFRVKSLIEKNNGKFYGSNFTLFGDMSQRFHEELEMLIIDSNRYSVDEAFGNLDTNCMPNLKEYGTYIQSTIRKNLGLEIGIGIGRTKTLSKLASWASKLKKWKSTTNGVVVLDSIEKETWALERVPVNDIWGCGTKTTTKLSSQGICTGKDLRDSDLKMMQSRFGVVIERTILELRGINAVELKDYDDPRQQICVSRTMGSIVTDLNTLSSSLSSHTKEAAIKLRRQKSWCRSVTVFIATNPFKPNDAQYQKTLSIELPQSTQSTIVLTKYAQFVLLKLFKQGYNYRKIGVLLSKLEASQEIQGDLFSDSKDEINPIIDTAVDRINEKFGRNTIKLASEGYNTNWKPKEDLAPPSYTTNINELPTAK